MVEVDILWLLGFLGAGAVAVYYVVKFRIRQVRILLEALAVLFAKYEDALADDKISEEEVRAIYDSLKIVFAAVRDIIHPNQ